MRCLLVILGIAGGLALPAAHAYNATPYQWAHGPINLVIALGPAGRTLQDGNTSWDAVAQSAVDEWNQNLGLAQFATVVEDDASPQQGDGKNTVAFSSNIYGDTFGDETIAVTLLHYTDHVTIGESDVLVNNQDTFDSYSGPLQNKGTSRNFDLRRVLLHEFGHVLGLGHPDAIRQTVAAVMNSVISDTDQLTSDDISGTTAIYGDPALRSVPVAAYGVAVDDGRGKIYVATTAANGKGKLQVIDPYAQKIAATIHTGTHPNIVALSGGGEYLYLGVDGLAAIDQFDPDTFTKTREFTLGAQPGVTAADIAVLPGQPESVLVSQVGNSQAALAHGGGVTTADFAVYDRGVLQPEEGFGSSDSPGSPIVIDEAGQVFYGFSGGFSDAANGWITRLSLDAGGVSPKVQYPGLPTGSLDGGVTYSQGLLFMSNGSVADLTDGVYQDPFPDVRSDDGAETVTVDAVLGQAYFAVANYSTPTLLVEDIASRSSLGTVSLPRYSRVLKMRRWGANGLIIGLNAKQMLLLRSNLIAPGPVTGSPPTVTLGAPKYASLGENDGLKDKFVVTRTNGDLSAPLDVAYTATGTSQSGVDYFPLSGVVTIPAGQATAKIKIVPTGSQFSDGPRTLQIRLAPNTSYLWGTPSFATITLTSG